MDYGQRSAAIKSAIQQEIAALEKSIQASSNLLFIEVGTPGFTETQHKSLDRQILQSKKKLAALIKKFNQM